ncbi:hypothetical protein PL18_06700 [Vibrio renipiscarius]|uniref:Uncharacterized protein n=1 Tax=Vibrio renipiscarius TaxID=1461322 RepID=A0A0C2JMP7_9VIBR|nr:hypothetical protein PL18_06700 [Vibrio renipiscarius]KII81013.1 hypothetical protein OJ16_06965 [Vibrio renipiscarius]
MFYLKRRTKKPSAPLKCRLYIVALNSNFVSLMRGFRNWAQLSAIRHSVNLGIFAEFQRDKYPTEHNEPRLIFMTTSTGYIPVLLEFAEALTGTLKPHHIAQPCDEAFVVRLLF